MASLSPACQAKGMVIAPRPRRGSRRALGVTTTTKMDYVVYILYSQKSSRYYVGQTDNIASRLKRHNASLVKSTKHGVPWRLVLTISVESRSKALILERKIKKRGAGRYLEDNQFGV